MTSSIDNEEIVAKLNRYREALSSFIARKITRDVWEDRLDTAKLLNDMYGANHNLDEIRGHIIKAIMDCREAEIELNQLKKWVDGDDQ